MASLYSVSVDAIALAAGVAKTALELATPATVRAVLVEWWVDFHGIDPIAVPVKVELMRGTATITGTAITALKMSDFAPAALVTAKHTATAEGTPTDLLVVRRWHPQTANGLQYPLGREAQIPVSSFLRIRLSAAAAVNATVGMLWEE